MFRKLAVGAVMSLGLLGTLGAAPAVQAHEPYPHHHHHRYKVLYRPCSRDHWECYGRYGCWEDADRAACRLRARGYEVIIRS
jgi:hypothetical protein